MSLNASIVEDAALSWSLLRQGHRGQVGEQFRVAASLLPAFSQREKESEQGKLAGRLCEAIRRLNPAATVKEYLSVQTKEPMP